MQYIGAGPATQVVLRNNLIHNVKGCGVGTYEDDGHVDIYNNIIHSATQCGVWINPASLQAGSRIRILNNTIYGNTNEGIGNGLARGSAAKGLLVRNNISVLNGFADFDCGPADALDPASSNNLSEDGTSGACSPAGGSVTSTVPAVALRERGGRQPPHRRREHGDERGRGPERRVRDGHRRGDSHRRLGHRSGRVRGDDGGEAAVVLRGGRRQAGACWNGGRRRSSTTSASTSTAVLPRAGPWTRLTSSLIPGLGSSAVGQAYSFRDAGLQNGTRYFYRLEDVDASSKTTSHGPVSAVPAAGAPGGAPGSEPPSSSPSAKKKGAYVCVLPRLGGGGVRLDGRRFCVLGDTQLHAPRRSRGGVARRRLAGLTTGDARAEDGRLLRAPSRPSGKVRVFVPGFDFPQDPQAPALPVRRALVDAVVGRRAQLGGVRALDQVGFPGLVPAALGKAEMQVSRDGTVRAGRRALQESSPQHVSLDLARLLPSVFQGETKSAVVQITPLRFDARRQQIVLSKRVLVKLLFTGARDRGERAGQLRAEGKAAEAGDRRASGAALHDGPRALRGFLRAALPGPAAGLRFVAAAAGAAGPGAGLARRSPLRTSSAPAACSTSTPTPRRRSTDFSSETAWELRARAGRRRRCRSSRPHPRVARSRRASTGQASFETNRFYQPGLLEAPDLWLWEGLASGATRAKSFSLPGVERGLLPGGGCSRSSCRGRRSRVMRSTTT